MFLQSLRESVSMEDMGGWGWLQRQEGTWPAPCKRFCDCAASSLLEPPPLPSSTAMAATAVTPWQQPGNRAAPPECPTWHHPLWLPLTLLAARHRLGCVSGYPLWGFLATNICMRSKGQWGCSWVNFSAVLFHSKGWGYCLSVSYPGKRTHTNISFYHNQANFGWLMHENIQKTYIDSILLQK